MTNSRSRFKSKQRDTGAKECSEQSLITHIDTLKDTHV